ncbi:hypothetical protein EDB81DRAFT_940887 [Dactylonectria macrodidyma]|uniref:Rhodopsin domain-containing protein n=1 Tax=Dactylonectria macrodidyma TaxID=307937 RepID=A0A9P9FM61_9HYPO|nr:hypothetical protein EDB81DRAFT_940887 [Dactylonectria macrodidyma]
MTTHHPLVPNVNNGPTLVISCGILEGIMLILYAVRMYGRFHPARNLWWDDYAVSFAVALSVTAYALRVVATRYGIGRHNSFITQKGQIQAQKYIFIVSCLWYFGVAFMRISVAFLLLRFRNSQRPSWALVLYIVIVTQFVLAVAALVIQITMCRPTRAFWEPVEDFRCLPALFSQVWGYCHTGLGIFTDLLLSAMPITFVLRMNILLWNRIVICFLMAAGLWTAATAMVKTVHIAQFTAASGDTLWHMYFLTFWSQLEEVIGIIAACIPCIKARVEALLRSFGVISISSTVEAPLNTFPPNSIHYQTEMSIT